MTRITTTPVEPSQPTNRARNGRLILALAVALIQSLLFAPAARADDPENTLFLPALFKSFPSAAIGSGTDQVGYATGTDRTLIRWYWFDDGAPTYRVYRQMGDDPEVVLADVEAIGNPAMVAHILDTTDPIWPNLSGDLFSRFAELGVTNAQTFQSFLREDRFVAQQLANEYYPVALVIGWGYLDKDIVSGQKYTYRVEALLPGGPETLGTVYLTAGQITPLLKPSGLQAIDMDPASSEHALPRDGEWGTVQRNRRFHQAIFLRWDQNAENASPPGAWVAGYDVYRQQGGDFTHVSPQEAIRPMPSSQPISETTSITGEVAYEQIDFYFSDRPDAPGTYTYRVAPRDLLGQVRQWPQHQAQFSDPAVGVAHDFLPPTTPYALEATPLPDNSGVLLTWNMTDTDDLDHFRIERTLAFTNPPQYAGCASDADCWMEVDTIPANTHEWTDGDGTLEAVRWYRIQAVDAVPTGGNRSNYAGPVQAVLHDVTPPGPPSVSLDSCSNSVGGYCIWGSSDAPDTTRMRIACRLSSDGEELLLDEVEGNQLVAYDVATHVFAPPLTLENVQCSVYAVDAHGNVSGPSAANLPRINSPLPPQVGRPAITEIETLGSGNDLTARIHWDVTDSPLLEGFRIDRGDVLSGNVDDLGTVGANERHYDDDTVEVGRTYLYSVTALIKFTDEEKSSFPRLYRALDDGQRPLTEFAWANLTWNGSNGAILEWDACGIADAPPFYFAIFRSIDQDSGYNQITPIMPFSGCHEVYMDSSARHSRYWYVVVQFDGRTGEPIGYTVPGEVSNHPLPPATTAPTYIPQDIMHSRLHNYVYQSSNGLAILPCTPFTPPSMNAGTILTFGGDFTLEIESAVVDGDDRISGSGILRMTPNGQPLDIEVTFSNVTVGDAQNHICHTGSLTHISFGDLLGHTIEVTPDNELSYRVIGLTLRSWFHTDNRAYGELVIDLPPSLRSVDHNGNESSILRLAGEDLRLNSTLAFEYNAELDEIVAHSCASPVYSWRMETLPTTVVPLEDIRIASSGFLFRPGIVSEASCMRYFERYSGVNGPRPAPTNHNVGDSNDGLLRATYLADQTVIDADGLDADYATQDNLAWIASYPFGFNMSITGDVELTLGASRIISGSTGAGGVQMSYLQKTSGAQAANLTATFAQATIDENGAIYALVQTPAEVTWLDGFRVDAGAWEFYAGALATPGWPAWKEGDVANTIMWRRRPGSTAPIDVPGGSVLPGGLEPGLNRRLASAPLYWGNCCGPEVEFTAGIDLYVRHGGVNDRFIAQLPGPISIPIYGYDGRLDHFEMAFLDNGVWDSNVTGEIDIPFPSNITIRLVDIWLAGDACGACIGGGIVPPDQREKRLEYWQVDVTLRTVEFHPDGPDPEPVCEKLLVANGDMTLLHLSEPDDPGPAVLDTELVFQQDGMAVPHILAYARGDYYFDRFPYLLEEVRLSSVGENADWQASATLSNPPNANWSQRGFVALQGAYVARYFGPLEGQKEGPENRPEVRYQAWEGGYVGFPEHLVADKTWVDLEIVEVAWRYDRLLYAVNDEGRGQFAGFRRYEFLPGDVVEQLQMVHLDTAIVLEPDRIDIFAGLSSGTALLRNLAEISGGSPPTNQQVNAWGTKLDMNQTGDYRDLLSDVWSGFGSQIFTGTTTVLDAYDDQPNQDLPNEQDFGGGTGGFLADAGVNFNRIRGDIQFVDASDPGRIQLDHFAMSCEVDILRQNEAGSLLHADRLGFEINRHGDYILEAVGVSSRLYASDLTLDATLRINPSLPQFEGGFSLHNFDIANVRVIEGSAALGVGAEINYVGVTFTGSFSSGPTGGSGTMGGSFLAGTIDPNSPVLQNHFSEVVESLSEVPSSPENDTPTTLLNGIYIRMYGDATLWNDGGLLQVNGGGEIATWLWVENIGAFTDIPDDVTDLLDYVTFGGKYRYFIHGKFLTVISARGDITFIYWDRPIPGGGGIGNIVNRARSLTGIAWVAGGLGFCDAGTWISWQTRWWDDSWCWTAGAYLEATVNLEGINPANVDLDVSWDADYEKP